MVVVDVGSFVVEYCEVIGIVLDKFVLIIIVLVDSFDDIK